MHNKTMKQYNKPRKSYTLFCLGFLANHLASTDNLTRRTKRQNTQQRKL